jgi:hypothetical protein
MPDGSLIMPDPQTGQWRPLAAEDYQHLRPTKFLDEMGTDKTERFTYKNFVVNPALLPAAIRAKHPDWDVIPYGDGFNAFIRKPGEDGWKVLDPAKGGLAEFWNDVTDVLVGDVILPTAGATLGAGAGPVGVGAGVAGAELVRQGIGSALGLPNNIDLTQAAVQGAAGGALSWGGALLGKAGRASARGVARAFQQRAPGQTPGIVSRGAEQFAGKVLGIEPGRRMPVSTIILDRAAMGKKPTITPSDAVNFYQEHLAGPAKGIVSELIDQRNAMMPEGTTINLRPMKDALTDLVGDVTSERTFRHGESALRQEMKEIARGLLTPPSREAIEAQLGAAANPGAVKAALRVATRQWELGLEKVPANVAFYIKNRLQSEAAARGAYAGTFANVPGSAERVDLDFLRNLATYTRDLNTTIKRQLPGAVARIDARVSRIISASHGMSRKLGADAANPEAFISGVFEKRGGPAFDLLRRYDAVMGTRLMDRAREAFIGLRFTPREVLPAEFGIPKTLPQMAASTGLPIGATGATSGIVGGLLGGPAGAVAGIAGGMALTSPAALTRIAPGLVKAGAAVQRGASRLAATSSGPASRLIGRAGVIAPGAKAAGAYGRHIADQDKKKKRRAYFLGG